MTPKEFVDKYMQDCQYGRELSPEAEDVARKNALVVVFGASDDLCEVRGVANDELGCYEGGDVYIAGAKVHIKWDNDGYSWTYDTDVPHECFDVYEDDEKYCRGIVFSILDVTPPSGADIVEVVRCGSCVHRKTATDERGNPVQYCSKSFGPMEVDLSDYCSNGERKDCESL